MMLWGTCSLRRITAAPAGSCVTIDMLYDSLNRLTGENLHHPGGQRSRGDLHGKLLLRRRRGKRLRQWTPHTPSGWQRQHDVELRRAWAGDRLDPIGEWVLSYTTSWTYNSADLPVTMIYPNGETVNFSYNAQMLLQGLSSSEGGTSFLPRTRVTTWRAG